MLSLHQLTLLPRHLRARVADRPPPRSSATPSRRSPSRSAALEKTLGRPASSAGSGAASCRPRWPTTLRPHAERTLAAAEEARRAVQSVTALETGTIRFGMFGTARLYAGAGLVADVLARHPGVRVELVGQNSSDVQEDLRRGRLEAAMIAVPTVTSEGMAVTPVARDELVYISADPERLRSPVTAHRLAEASLVMPETTWRADDSTRIVLRQMLHETGRNPQTRIEVEDVETAVELVGMGLADSVIPQGRGRAAAAPAWRRTPAGSRCGPSSSTRSRSCTGPGPRSHPRPG